jgi:hypothetical protein
MRSHRGRGIDSCHQSAKAKPAAEPKKNKFPWKFKRAILKTGKLRVHIGRV